MSLSEKNRAKIMLGLTDVRGRDAEDKPFLITPQQQLDRRVKAGLDDEDVLWNDRFGRPLHWMETANPEEEVQRRKEWTAAQTEFEALVKVATAEE